MWGVKKVLKWCEYRCVGGIVVEVGGLGGGIGVGVR